jgi:hypothetical protein
MDNNVIAANQVSEEKSVFFVYGEVEEFKEPYLYGENGHQPYLRTNMFMGHRICDIKSWILGIRDEILAFCSTRILSFVSGEMVDAIITAGDSSRSAADVRFGSVSLQQLAEAFQYHQLNGVPLGITWAKRICIWLLLRSPLPFLQDGERVRFCNHKRVLGFEKSVFDQLMDSVNVGFKATFPGHACSLRVTNLHEHKKDTDANEAVRDFTIVARLYDPSVDSSCEGSYGSSWRSKTGKSYATNHSTSTGKKGNHITRAQAKKVVRDDNRTNLETPRIGGARGAGSA